ncbi:MAG: maltose alpha-D-glucosyltransferase [Acidobacteriota bacterium]
MPIRDYQLDGDPLWYKDAIIYEVHVRAYYDANGDGMGDFSGLEEKLDYIKDLGVTAVWVLPFSPSPWRDDGYDISDYTGVHPAYGTLRDFHSFLKAAHRRGLRVITELIMNHTSDQHAWFQRARRAPAGSKARAFYVWSDTPDKYADCRIIFKDTESSNWTWDPVARQYFWHRFFSHQPDLNFDNPRVRRAMLDVVDFWLDMGVDGLRLDAVPYLYEREGSTCENLPETHAFLKDLRRHVDGKYKSRMLLAEANQWPEDAVAYFANGDESHMNFHFPLMPRLFMAMRMEDRFPIIDIMEQTPPIPDNCQWAMFLRNHDELTLEMVTDEERDYMYRVYATDPQMRLNLGIRRRLAPLLGNDRRRVELMNALLFSLPGTPIVYYGDEIGMGDNIYLGDRNGVRTPMQWSADRNAGFSRANPQRLYLPVIIDPEFHYEAVNVENQQQNPNSLLWFMKRLIALRKEHRVLGRGTLEFIQPDNRKVLAFVRKYEGEQLLVIANLSRFVQGAELDLSAYKGLAPVELFGRSEFPPIGDLPYLITLGPHSFYWFSLERVRQPVAAAGGAPEEDAVPVLTVDRWNGVFTPASRAALAKFLPAYLRRRAWFAGQGRKIRLVSITDVLDLPGNSYMLLIDVEYSDGDPDIYTLPVTLATGEQAAQLSGEAARTLLARLRSLDGEEGALYGALYNKRFTQDLLVSMARRRRFRGEQGELIAAPTAAFRRQNDLAPEAFEPAVQKAEQSSSTIVYGDRFVLKLFRRLEPGINPDLEIGYYLTEKAHFEHVPPVAGALEYRRDGATMTAGILRGYVPNAGTAWQYTLDSLGGYFEEALAHREQVQEPPKLEPASVSLFDEEIPAAARQMIGAYLESAKLLGRRTAGMHLALAAEASDPNFAPEPFTDFYRQSLYHGLLGLCGRSMTLLRQRLKVLSEPALSDARKVLSLEPDIRRRLQSIRDRRVGAMRIRCHGNYHLGHVLFTGKDFCIINFEGQPARPISERRIKRSPLRDVASMVRSFQYASYSVFHGGTPGVIARPEDRPALEVWARYWNRWVALAFLREYLEAAAGAPFLPKSRESIAVMLLTFLLDAALEEVLYELSARPDWAGLPLQGILNVMEASWPS